MGKKSETVVIGMRLPVDIVTRLDNLAKRTNGSRRTVIIDLVRRAEVLQIDAPIAYLMVRVPDEVRDAAIVCESPQTA